MSILFLASCGSPDEDYCIKENDFDQESVYLPAGPNHKSVIQGEYNPQSGGEIRDWIDTGYVSDGNGFSIRISGSWNPWSQHNNISPCKMVARKDKSFTNYCYRESHDNEEKVADINNLNNPNDNCTNLGPLNNAKYGIYHINRCSLTVSEALKNPAEQIEGVYSKGMGAYIGLFGRNGYETPLRAYHLFTEKELCDVVRDATSSLCLDKKGNDITTYVFESVNNKIFVKDDGATTNPNDGSDTISEDDTYHKARESVKLIIHDTYYSDNGGGYYVTFDRGVIKSEYKGPFEYVVSLFEDYLLGDFDENTKERDGGIVKEFYDKIVANSTFINIVQLLIGFYIIIFGVAIIMGVAQVSGSDAVARIIKLGLITMFISPTSWYIYNEYVVGLFKDGMDSLIKLFGDIADGIYDESSLINVAKANREIAYSDSTRFSFIDHLISKLFSEAVARKIGGLFFGYSLGFFYVISIGFSIIAFFLVMMLAAFTYIENLIRMSILLAVGPMLFPFWLFSRTSGIFTKWAGNLASSSVSILLLFVSLYNMLIILDTKFTELFAFKACLKNVMLGPLIPIRVFVADSDLSGFVVDLVEIFSLIFITKVVIEKIPEVSGGIIKIAGVSPPNFGGVAGAVSKAASGILSAVKAPALAGLRASGAVAGSVVKEGGKTVGGLAKMGYFAATGQKDEVKRVKQEMADGFFSVASSGSSTASKSIVNAAANEAKKQGLTGSRATSFVRRQAFAKAREGGKSVNFKILQRELKLHEKSQLKKSIKSSDKLITGNTNSFSRREQIRSLLKKEGADMGIKSSRIDKMLKSREFIAEFNRVGVGNAKDVMQKQSSESLVKYMQSLETERLLGAGRSGFGDKVKSFFGVGEDALNPRQNLRKLGRFADEQDYYQDKKDRESVHLNKKRDLIGRGKWFVASLKGIGFDAKDTAKEFANDASGKFKDVGNALIFRKDDATKSAKEFFGKLYDRNVNNPDANRDANNLLIREDLSREDYIRNMMQETGKAVKQDLMDRLNYHLIALGGDEDDVNNLAIKQEINVINEALKKVDSEYLEYDLTEKRPDGAYRWVNGVKVDKDGNLIIETTEERAMVAEERAMVAEERAMVAEERAMVDEERAMLIGKNVNVNPNSEVSIDDFIGFDKATNKGFDFASEFAGIKESIVNNDQNIAAIQDLKLKVSILEMKQRTSAFIVKTKEYEIFKLKEKGPAKFADQIANLQKEIDEISGNKVYLDSQISNLNQEISTLNNK